MLTRVMWAAVLSGLAAGLLLSALQAWKILPLIERAEVYEVAAGTGHSHGNDAPAETDGHAHDAEGEASKEPADGVQRLTLTVLTNILVACGYGLILAGLVALTGLPLTLQNGWIWGLLGFVSVALLPAFGLPPELPGMAAGELISRQIWWLAAAGFAVAGMVLIAMKRAPGFIAVGLFIIALPHLVGAPASPMTQQVPAELAAAHVSASQTVMAIFWVALATIQGYLLHARSDEEA
jgi:cobalt transporter subunit CbtA